MPLAQFEFSVNDLIQALDKADLFDAESQERLLTAGSAHLIDEIKQETNRSTYNLKWISPKIKAGKMKKNKNGEYSTTVTLNGKNERGERFATIAFVLNYGRQKKYGLIKGQYFWTRAVKSTDKTISQVYEKEVNKILQERGLS